MMDRTTADAFGREFEDITNHPLADYSHIEEMMHKMVRKYGAENAPDHDTWHEFTPAGFAAAVETAVLAEIERITSEDHFPAFYLRDLADLLGRIRKALV